MVVGISVTDIHVEDVDISTESHYAFPAASENPVENL